MHEYQTSVIRRWPRRWQARKKLLEVNNISKKVPEICATWGGVGLIAFGRWVGLLLIALAASLWVFRTVVQPVEHQT